MRRHDVLVGLPGAGGISHEVANHVSCSSVISVDAQPLAVAGDLLPGFPEPASISPQCLRTPLRNPGKDVEVNDASPLELHLPEPAAGGPLPSPSPCEDVEVALRAFRSRIDTIGQGDEEPVTAPP